MAIPEGRLSTDWNATAAGFTEPEDRPYYGLICHEKGPVGIEDPTQGLAFQNWTFTYNWQTQEVTGTPETVGDPVVIHTLASCDAFDCTFDQNGRVTIAYMDNGCYLWWYDSAAAQRVTTDFGADIVSCCVYLDDKRNTQNTANDMLFWYTKQNVNDLYDLYMRVQRERFQTEHLMASDIAYGYIYNNGMNSKLRGQLNLRATPLF